MSCADTTVDPLRDHSQRMEHGLPTEDRRQSMALRGSEMLGVPYNVQTHFGSVFAHDSALGHLKVLSGGWHWPPWQGS